VDDETIYRKNRDDLIRYATVLVGPAGAEDVVSVVVLRILAKRRLQDLEEPRAYLFRAVLNESKTRLSRRRTYLNVADVETGQADDPQPHIVQAVLELPPRQRAATYLVYWAGMTVAETAELMGIRTGTAKRYLHIARRTLKGVLDEQRTG
jgi:RNA polymerase sigma-70 factor (ECF subfamily)